MTTVCRNKRFKILMLFKSCTDSQKKRFIMIKVCNEARHFICLAIIHDSKILLGQNYNNQCKVLGCGFIIFIYHAERNYKNIDRYWMATITKSLEHNFSILAICYSYCI